PRRARPTQGPPAERAPSTVVEPFDRLRNHLSKPPRPTVVELVETTRVRAGPGSCVRAGWTRSDGLAARVAASVGGVPDVGVPRHASLDAPSDRAPRRARPTQGPPAERTLSTVVEPFDRLRNHLS